MRSRGGTLTLPLQRRVGHERQRLDVALAMAVAALVSCLSRLSLAQVAALRCRLLAGRLVGVDVRRRRGRAGRPRWSRSRTSPAASSSVRRTKAVPRTSVMLLAPARARPGGARSRRWRARRCRTAAGRTWRRPGCERRTLSLPVVVVRDAAQAASMPPSTMRHVVEGLAAALAVDEAARSGRLPPTSPGRVGVVAADLAVRGVAVDHRIHVAGGDAEEQVRLAQRLEGLGAVPVGLGDDADAKALRLQHAADHRHAEAGVVDIGVAGDDDDVAAVPAQLRPSRRGSSAGTAPCRSAAPSTGGSWSAAWRRARKRRRRQGRSCGSTR